VRATRRVWKYFIHAPCTFFREVLGANCRCRQPRSRGFVRGAQAPSVTPGFSRGTRSAVVGKPHAVAVGQARRCAAQFVVVVVSLLLSFIQARQGKGRVHNGAYFYTSNENRTRCVRYAALGNLSSTHRAHFLRVAQASQEMGSIRGHQMMYHAQADGARRNKFLHGTHDFASCCHATFPTAPFHVSHQKTGLMCTFLKNRVRFASRAAHLTCTKNLTRATLCLRKMVHNDLHGCVYHSLSVVICTRCVLCGGFCRAMCGGFEFVVAVSPGRPPWNGTARRYQPGGVHHRAHFFAVLVVNA